MTRRRRQGGPRLWREFVVLAAYLLGLAKGQNLLAPHHAHFRLEFANENAAIRGRHCPLKRNDPVFHVLEEFVERGVKFMLEVVVAELFGACP